MRLPAATTDGAQLCPDCAHWGKRALGLLEWDYRRLERSIGERSPGLANDRVTSTPTPPTPLNLGVEALMTATAYLAVTIARLLCERIKLEQKHTRRGGLAREYVAICWSTRLAREHYDTLLDLDAQPVRLWVPRGYEMDRGDGWVVKELTGAELVLMAVRLHNEVTKELGLGSARVRLPLPCPHCGNLTLHKEIADDSLHTVSILCINCPQSRWTEAEYDWLKTMLLDEQNKLAKWLVAEAIWKAQQAEAKLERVHDLIALATTDQEVAGMPGEVFARYLGEILEP